MKHLVAIVILGLAACGMEVGNSDDQCTTSLSVTPSMAHVDEEVTVTAIIDDPYGGIPSIDWRVRFDQGDVTFLTHGESEISFTPTAPGTYSVEMTPLSGACSSQFQNINVLARTGDELDVRLHVTPPADLNVPPIDRIMIIPAGSVGYALGAVVLDGGRVTSGTVGVPAYLKFMPDGQPEAIVEAYTNGTGAYTARVQTVSHHILVVPTDPTYPPQVIAATPSASDVFTLDVGTDIAGTVRRPNNTGLGGAKVQLMIAGVPSTTATTAADGSFLLRTSSTSGLVQVIVTPPAGSGLPRLEAQSSAFTLSSGLTIAYASTLVTRNAIGTDIVRGGGLANATVTIVGTIPAAGTVTAGAAATALGVVRIAATADGTGALPSTPVPAADLFAVVAAAPGDYAVVAFDTTTTVPGTITAPPMVAFSTSVKHASASIGGARLELVPAGALELAGAAPTVLYGSQNGTLSGTIASGGVYTARFSDPSRGAGPVSVPSVTAIPSMLMLPDALEVIGTLEIQTQANRIPGAAVEVLCNADGATPCEGVERNRALGEDASDAQGSFVVAIAPPPAS